MDSAAGSTGNDARIEFSVSDPAELSSLSQWLERGGRARVDWTSAAPTQGELGVADILTAMGSGGALVAAIGVLPEFIRSRRSSFRIEATVKGERFVLAAENADEQVTRMAARIIDSVLGD